MLKRIKNLINNTFLFAIFCLFLGAVLLFYPNVSRNVISYGIAGFLAVYGIVHLTLHCIVHQKWSFSMDSIQGIVGILIAVFLAIYPQVISVILPVVLGVILIIDGALKPQLAIGLKKNFDKWYIVLLLGSVSVILGMIMLAYSQDLKFPMYMFIGGSYLVNGIVDCIHLYLVFKYRK